MKLKVYCSIQFNVGTKYLERILCIVLFLSLQITGCSFRHNYHPIDSLEASKPSAAQSEIETINADIREDKLIKDANKSNYSELSTGDTASENSVAISEEDLDAEDSINPVLEDDMTAGSTLAHSQSSDSDLSSSELYMQGYNHKDHPLVKKWIDFFSVKKRSLYQRYLNRGYVYKDMIQHILEKNDVPKELFYLAMIESGFTTSARSHAGAVGIWQFIRGTGRRYGLNVSRYLDERRDPVRSTYAAANYLKDLHRVYQDWYLAMGGYNAGERRILSAVMGAATRDFWILAEKKKLPKETRNYVPKFIAAMVIGENLEKYGFKKPNSRPFPNLKIVETHSWTSLSKVAKNHGVSYNVLKKLNPHIRYNKIPATRGGYKVWLPQNNAAAKFVLADGLISASLSSNKTSKRTYDSNITDSGSKYHRVQRGENLSIIARKYGLSLASLKSLNGLRSNRIYPGKRLVVSGESTSNATYHKVRRGENLHLIAKKYGLSISELKRLNGLRSSKIYPGKRLLVRGSSSSTPNGERTERVYRVKRGDSWYKIAQKFGTSVKKLKRINNKNRNRVYVGEQLLVSI